MTLMAFLASVVSFVAFVLYCDLLIIVLRRDARSPLYLAFSLYLISMAVWSFGSFMIFTDLGIFTTLFWNRFMLIGSLAMPITFYNFSQAYLMRKRRGWVVLGLAAYAVLQAANFSGFIITDAFLKDGFLYNTYAEIGIMVTSTVWAGFVGLLGLDLFREYRRTKIPVHRERIRYLLVVTLLIFTGSLTNTTDLRVFPVDIAFNALAAFLIAYAMLRHHFLDINLVVRKGLLYSVPTIIVGVGYFLVISLSINLLHAVSGPQLFILSLVVAVMAALLAQPFRDKAQGWIDRIFFREKYDANLMLQRISHTAVSVLDLERLTNLIIEELTRALHIEQAGIFVRDEDSDHFTLIAQRGLQNVHHLRINASNPVVLWLNQSARVLSRADLEVLPQFKALWKQERQELEQLGAELFISLMVSKNLVGILVIGPKQSELPYSEDDQLLLTTLANQTAVAINNARLYDTVRQELQERKRAEQHQQLQLQRLSAIHAIDVSITTNVNQETTLEVLLEQVLEQQRVDAAAVLLLNKNTRTLEYAVSRGFNTAALQHTRLRLGEGLAGQAAMQQVVISIQDLTATDTSLSRSPLIVNESFVSYIGVPLISKGQVKGVLEVFHRSMLKTDADWLDFLESLATEAAIVLDNISMLNDLQESNLEMELAYKNTLEGWSRALELRDVETEGHSQRVTGLTLGLARYLGIKGDALKYVQWGALLHDIGKMGIPDQLLLKEGPLTLDEMQIMQQHPGHGYKLLSSIPFLRPALDIPYSHHEKWDGTGYPRGLRGEEIPLAARIFAVVDVWDALISDRPYRKAWSRERALNYIKNQSDKHFDPRIVEAFLDYILKTEIINEEELMNSQVDLWS
jgi:HD-GYP domain-containing protein (c-di-GMP phosphodiesterase class II)